MQIKRISNEEPATDAPLPGRPLVQVGQIAVAIGDPLGHDLHRLLVGEGIERKARLTILRDGPLEHLWVTPQERK